ncbi:MAG: Crp/Fnr family transcriptional regulator [Clostridia bacterium]|nr:Crp/Fnr family transcriptional regulator [Clostridia bacterium]
MKVKLSDQFERAQQKSRLFSVLPFAENDFIKVEAGRGKQLCRSIEGRAGVGLVVRGKINAFSVSQDGNRVLLSKLGCGDCFGVNDLFFGCDSVTELICAERSVIFYLPKQKVVNALLSDSRLFARYAELADGKLQFLLKRIRLLTMTSCRNKVIEYLLDSESAIIYFDGSKENLAKQLAMSRTALFREFKMLTDEGIVEYDNKHVKILNRKALQERFDKVGD